MLKRKWLLKGSEMSRDESLRAGLMGLMNLLSLTWGRDYKTALESIAQNPKLSVSCAKCKTHHGSQMLSWVSGPAFPPIYPGAFCLSRVVL